MRFRSRAAAQSGHVLLVALFVIAMTMAASALLASSLGWRMWLIRHEARHLHLTSLTDAAVAQALAELSRSPGYRGTEGAVPFDDGTYAITVVPTGARTVDVDVRATYGGGGRAARAEVRLRPIPGTSRWRVEVTRWEPMPFQP